MSDSSPLDVLAQASSRRLVCIGDVMLDRFVYGDVGRISPEAPVPVLKRQRTVAMPGGAGNVVRNLASLGAKVTLIGIVGDDAEGRELAHLIGETKGVSGDLISVRGRPTTLKTRFVAGGQQLMRVDAEDSAPIDAKTETKLIEALSAEVQSAHAIILSDYAKGALTEKVIAAATEAAKSHAIPVIVDPKGSDFNKYGPVDVIKPNAKELAEVVGLPVESDGEIERALEAALDDSGANAIIVTRAAKGMSCISRDTPVAHFRGRAREVYDVSGAGDTSIAALALAIASDVPLSAALRLAIAASGIAVGKSGTASVTADEVRTTFLLGVQGGSLAHTSLEDTRSQASRWRDSGFSIGFTNGCFDILHPGHLRVLEEAKSRCDRLVVGLNSDASVSRLKGEGRPINDAASRARVLMGLSAVDAVVVFEDDTPAHLIKTLEPDLLVKGGDYTIETIVGADDVLRRGGKVHIVEIVEGQSTTAAIERAKA